MRRSVQETERDKCTGKYDFQKVQEILGQDHKEGLRILEEHSEKAVR